MLLGYCGSGYYGMQYNPPHKTIEGEILTKLFDVGAHFRRKFIGTEEKFLYGSGKNRQGCTRYVESTVAKDHIARGHSSEVERRTTARNTRVGYPACQ